MIDCKPIQTPIVDFNIKSEEAVDYHDASYYKVLVGSLQYSTITRPDIVVAMNSMW